MTVSSDLHIPDTKYWREQIKCQSACPVNTDARGYITAIAEGNDELAYLIARGPNPLASICGRVCGAPCEAACRRGDFDKPVAIRALKRFVCEKFGTEAREAGGKGLIDFLKAASAKYRDRQCAGSEELLPMMQALMVGDVPEISGKTVGIIGSGPAGLAAAHDLALLGCEVTIYEMEPVLAGMLALGIPEYRLPRDLIAAEVEVILELGVKAKTNCCIGKDIAFEELRKRHDAIIVAVGAKKSRHIPIPGADAEGVIGGVEFLREVSLGRPPALGKNVVVIGGGNVAYDVGRTVVRQASIDAARVAKRAEGVGQVHLCSLESLDEMPADDIEIIEGDEEGVLRKNSLGPKEFLVKDGHVCGVRFQKCLRVFDEEHRFAPQFDESDITDIPCDHVLVSIGQTFDLSFIDSERDGLELLPNGAIKCDADTGITSAADVFIAGDLAYGPKLLIHGVKSGKSVARSVYQHLTGEAIRSEDVELHFPVEDYEREDGYEKLARVTISTIDPELRLGAQDTVVERGFSEAEARCEAARCLNCGVNTIFDGMRCILCGGCVEVCPENCLVIVPISQLNEQVDIVNPIMENQFGEATDDASAILKDETTCIRCALCAERCPTGAITMEEFHFRSRCYVEPIGS